MFLEKDGAGGSRFNELTRLWTENNDCEVTVLAGMVNYASGKKENPLYKGKFIFREKYNPNLDVVRCYVSEAYNLNFGGRLWGYFSFVFSSLYAGIFKVRGKFDVILVTSPPLFVGITAYILSRLKGIPFVFEVRDLWPESAIDTGVLKNKWIINLAYWFEEFIYRKAKRINVLTPAFRDKLIEVKNVPVGKIIFIPNAADFTLADELLVTFDRESFRRDHHLEGKVVITYVGAHGVANHLIQLLETAALLRQDHSEVLFLLIGEGMQKLWLQEKAREMNLPNVRFIAAVPKKEVFKYILASDFGTSVLKKANTFKTVYSNKTFDYMSCKKPILMVIDGVSRSLVEEAKCGSYVEPENPTHFAEIVKKYLKEGRQNWEKEGTRGYSFAKQHFDRTDLAKRYLAQLV